MTFNIAGKTYPVVIHPRQIIRNGVVRQAWFDAVNRRILIAADVAREDRRRWLLHELRHAWTTIHGLPTDSESDAVSVGTFTDLVLEQFEAEGGDAALRLLDPPVGSVPQHGAPHIIRDRQTCGLCRAEVMCGSIANGVPTFADEHGCFVMPRGMHCENCGSITAWIETCTPAGTPLGTFIANPPPRVLSGDEARAWVAEHGDKCGLICA